jgi:hypothetical protein
MPPYIPPPAGELEAATEEAIAGWGAALASPEPWVEARAAEVLGIGAIIAEQFHDVPAATLGRILASASMALGAICKAAEVTGEPLEPWDLAGYLGLAGARLAGAGGEMTAVQAGPGGAPTVPGG